MPTIRLLESEDPKGEAWFALLEVGPIQRIPPVEDRIYVVTQNHIRRLRELKLPFEEIEPKELNKAKAKAKA